HARGIADRTGEAGARRSQGRHDAGRAHRGAGAAARMTIDRGAIERVHSLIAPYIRRTPVVEIDGIDVGQPGPRITLKLELMQRPGSFKTRGAFANLLTRAIPDAGVVAASGGNHGAAVAFAAMTLKIPARIFVPTVSSPAKVARIRSYGADLVV